MSTTTARPAGDVASFLGGFIAGEGYLWAGERDFRCAVALGAADAAMCHLLRDFLGVGRIHRYARRRPHYDDEIVWVVRSLRELVHVVVPFLDEHLPLSYKQQQYVAWRAQVMAYWDERARQRRTCIIDGCDRTMRANGLCRAHYYAAYGR